MNLTQETLERIKRLSDKYSATGQDLDGYLDGLLYADYLTYWDYIHLDTLLSLQTPKTPIPDEHIFVIYHQITELYFKLIIEAIKRVANEANPTGSLLKRQLKRITNYLNQLIDSFGIMVEGMDKDEFQKFRMSLLPASGFQSAQYRMIEIMSTDFTNLIHFTQRDNTEILSSTESIYQNIYWKRGATEAATGKKTYTLIQFESKYATSFLNTANEFTGKNLWQTYKKLSAEEQNDSELIELMKHHDTNLNVRWPLSHLRSAMRHLNKNSQEIAATGGTNWQDYLPPKNQRIILFPELWSEEELNDWGKKM
jgi:tryptophan 2,3-dioxygenase